MRRLFFLFLRASRSDLRILWAALRSSQRPGWLLPVVALLLVFGLEPLNFAVPLLGVADDFVLLPLALHWLVKMLPPALREEAPAR